MVFIVHHKRHTAVIGPISLDLLTQDKCYTVHNGHTENDLVYVMHIFFPSHLNQLILF